MKKKWGVVQLVGHLTVNEDGEGSNPSAPANFLNAKNSTLFRRKASVAPSFPPAIHRFHVGVAHFLEALRHERGAKSAAAVKDKLCVGLGHALFNVALDNSF